MWSFEIKYIGEKIVFYSWNIHAVALCRCICLHTLSSFSQINRFWSRGEGDRLLCWDCGSNYGSNFIWPMVILLFQAHIPINRANSWHDWGNRWVTEEKKYFIWVICLIFNNYLFHHSFYSIPSINSFSMSILSFFSKFASFPVHTAN